MGKANQAPGVSKQVRSLLAMALLAGSTAAWAQVANPGFEGGSLAPWAATFAGVDNGVGVSNSQGPVSPHAGGNFAHGFDNDGIGRLSQTVPTAAGATYSLSVWVSLSNVSPSNVASIRLGAANAPVACALGAPGVWTQCTGSFTATGSSERLDLLFGTASGAGIVAFDDVTLTQSGGQTAVQAVPTLGEWGLLALGLAAGGLGLRRLRRRD